MKRRFLHLLMQCIWDLLYMTDFWKCNKEKVLLKVLLLFSRLSRDFFIKTAPNKDSRNPETSDSDNRLGAHEQTWQEATLMWKYTQLKSQLNIWIMKIPQPGHRFQPSARAGLEQQGTRRFHLWTSWAVANMPHGLRGSVQPQRRSD